MITQYYEQENAESANVAGRVGNCLSRTKGLHQYMGVSKKGGIPKLLFIMENPIKTNGLGGTTIFGNIHISR